MTATATTTWISGPVLRATTAGGFLLREAVSVGEARLLGEVIRVAREEITVQVYEDTSGLRPGDPVAGSGRLLSVRLGPGILGQIFDGLLRPIGVDSTDADAAWVRPGMREAAAGSFRFTPTVAVGERVSPGAVIGDVGRAADDGTQGGVRQRCLVPPDAAPGEVVQLAGTGSVGEDNAVCTLRTDDGGEFDVALSHRWPVRMPRPVAKRLPADEPMLTGQRILDCLFPIARGGTASIPGGFGTGKTVLLETIDE
jgi:V/A-type H+-transporting ATPase subunit A